MAGMRGWIFVILLTVIVILLLANRILSGRLRAEYAVFWGAFGLLLLPFGLWPSLVDTLADLVGIDYAPSLLFVFIGLFTTGYLVHLSEKSSEQRRKIRRLSQEIAYLKQNLNDGLSSDFSQRETQGS